jgi:hypothetical protein
MIISVAKDFSETPGPRVPEEGDYSGLQFLHDLLRPKYLKAIEDHTTLTIDLDGTEGYATSFLEAAFGGLAREFDASDVLKVIQFKSNDEPYLVQEIIKYMKDARK